MQLALAELKELRGALGHSLERVERVHDTQVIRQGELAAAFESELYHLKITRAELQGILAASSKQGGLVPAKPGGVSAFISGLLSHSL
jgi:hypothetical protein